MFTYKKHHVEASQREANSFSMSKGLQQIDIHYNNAKESQKVINLSLQQI